jgi:hypothetical protein
LRNVNVETKDELKIYSNFCNNSSAKENYSDICKDIFQESNAIADKKEEKEWEDFNKKYWVEYNPRAKNGYSVYEKKSNFLILGEGLAQSANQFIPMWMNNMQLSNQIDVMTNQALYQKQLSYMSAPNSPWMNLPYMQGNYFPNPMLNPMFNPSFNMSNPFLNNPGFNFSK